MKYLLNFRSIRLAITIPLIITFILAAMGITGILLNSNQKTVNEVFIQLKNEMTQQVWNELYVNVNEELGKTLQAMPVGAHGQVVVVDDMGKLVATSTTEPVSKTVNGEVENIAAVDSSNFVTRCVIGRFGNRDIKGVERITLEGEAYQVSKSHFSIDGIEWDIYTVIYEDDFVSGVEAILLHGIIQVGLVLMGFFVVMLIIVRAVIQPIIHLNQKAKLLALGIYQEIKVEGRRDEFYELAQSFNVMGQKQTMLVERLDEEVRKRTAELEESNRQLHVMSYTDELMKIPNRRRFDEFLSHAMELAAMSNTVISLLMMDIDDFKGYNDYYGHTAGDECLRKIGVALKECIKRNTDLVARYGGEEIVAIIQVTSKEDVKKIAKEIRTAVLGLGIENARSEWGLVTVSIGVAVGKIKPGQHVREFIDEADKAMYKAKRSGKNRIEYTDFNADLENGVS